MDGCCGKRFEADMQARVVQSIRGLSQRMITFFSELSSGMT